LASICIFVPIVFALLTRWKEAPTYQLAAVPAVFSTIWMSHRHHDLLILSLLVVPLFSLTLKQQRLKIITAVVLIAYCFPHLTIFYGKAHFWPVPFLYRVIWLFGLVYLLEPMKWPKVKA
jgi:hypothetical protein